jgi:hypothetical protein
MRDLVFYTHIPKTAGTSFYNTLIAPNFADGQSLVGPTLRTIAGRLRPEHAIAWGHFPYGLHRLAGRNPIYITMLREPIDRAISYYYFVKDQDPARYVHPDRKYAESLGLAEFYRLGRFRNVMTRYLADWAFLKAGGHVPTALWGGAALAMARRHLERRYRCFGLLERFDDSVALFEKRMGWARGPLDTESKKTQGRLRKEEIDPATLASLRASNRLDVELYEFARALFEENLRREGLAPAPAAP